MEPRTGGIHHITAIAGDPRTNLTFYREVLGLRLVKRTVNFDAPTTHHLYYGNATGQPGTVLTFFPRPGAARGRRGRGQVVTVSFSVPKGSLPYWSRRLEERGVEVAGPRERLWERALAFEDPDGLRLELVAPGREDTREPWREGPVPPEHAVRGFHGAELCPDGPRHTVSVLTDVMGFRPVGGHPVDGGDGDDAPDGQSGAPGDRGAADGGSAMAGPAGSGAHRSRYAVAGGGSGRLLDVVARPGAPPGRVAAGTVHHIAFRADDAATQRAWREKLARAGLKVTSVIDRRYFRSIYFREPGGILFEIATDGPGFSVDEPVDELGSGLALPPWLEGRREELEAALPPL